jgi:hypothetical protein
MWKKNWILSLLFFGMMSLSCIAAENERSPLLGTHTQQPRSTEFPSHGQQSASEEHFQREFPSHGRQSASEEHFQQVERVYREGVRFLEEAKRIESINDAVPRGQRVPITWDSYRAARKSGLDYLKEASSQGHIGAKVQIEKYYQDGGRLKNIQKTSYCFGETPTGNEGSKCWLCFAYSYFVCPVPCCCIRPFLFDLNWTSEEEIRETNVQFDRDMQNLIELEALASSAQDLISKVEISRLKENVIRARAEYDETVSLCCRPEHCSLPCFNCRK